MSAILKFDFQKRKQLRFSEVNYDHNWQKSKSAFLTCHCHEIYREETVGLKSFNYTLKIMIFCEYVKFDAISLKIDIL